MTQLIVHHKQFSRIDKCDLSHDTRARVIQIFQAINAQCHTVTPAIFGQGDHCEIAWWPGYTIIIHAPGQIACYDGKKLAPSLIIGSACNDLSPLVEWLKTDTAETVFVDEFHLTSSDEDSSSE